MPQDHPSLAKFRREMMSGSLALMLLALLEKIGEPAYGYQLSRWLAEYAPDGEAPKQGTLYPALRSLEKLGLLTSAIEPSTSGPPRRYYRPTDEGRIALIAWRATWQRMTAHVEAVLAELPPLPTQPETDGAPE